MNKEPIEHKHFKDAREHLRFALREHVPGGMVAICGMPGAGKTFLRNQVLREILGAPESWGQGFIPATEVMALLDTNSAFSSKAFAARSHRAVLRPDLRALYRDASEEITESYLESLRAAEKAWATSRAAQRTPEHEYWRSFSEAVIDRKIKYVLVEHAAAIGKVAKGEEPGNHLWNLMSLFDSTGCMGILNLIPDGYALWEGRPEIAERLERIFIRPYDLLDKEQLTEFADMVFKVAKKYELESDEVIMNQITEIAIDTATGMRPVEKLLARASVNARSRGVSKIGAEDIASAFETTEHVAALWRQARLLDTISRPATKDELYAIHRLHLGELG
jgi:hypothetical protein